MVVKNPHVVWNMHETEDSCPERTLPDNKLFMPLLWQNIFILRVHVGSLHRTKVKLCKIHKDMNMEMVKPYLQLVIPD